MELYGELAGGEDRRLFSAEPDKPEPGRFDIARTLRKAEAESGDADAHS
ncbi:hypothetical protein [Nocardia sp. NPDC058497]